MKVAIIGTGNMGAGLSATLAGAGHEICIGARDLVKAAALAEEIGHGAIGGGIAAAAKGIGQGHGVVAHDRFIAGNSRQDSFTAAAKPGHRMEGYGTGHDDLISPNGFGIEPNIVAVRRRTDFYEVFCIFDGFGGYFTSRPKRFYLRFISYVDSHKKLKAYGTKRLIFSGINLSFDFSHRIKCHLHDYQYSRTTEIKRYTHCFDK